MKNKLSHTLMKNHVELNFLHLNGTEIYCCLQCLQKIALFTLGAVHKLRYAIEVDEWSIKT